MSPPSQPLRILFSAPAYWPALAFGGPISMARELNEGMIRRHGHAVDVLTTSLRDIGAGRSHRTVTGDVQGVHVRYLATPLRYRWMGVTPSAPWWLGQLEPPDVAHIFGFRDPLGTMVAAWCRLRGVPYVLEPLGMSLPRLRKVHLKRILDRSVLRWVPSGAAAIVVTSEHERRQAVAAGMPARRMTVRGNGFPATDGNRIATGALRRAIGLADEPLILYVGRIASGKGIEFLLETVHEVEGAHLALVGPDDGHGVSRAIAAAQSDRRTAGRIHRLVPATRPLELYADADVFVLASAGESFGMAAAEAAAAGVPVVVTDRCGIAEALGSEGALVVPYDAGEVRRAVTQVLSDEDLRARLSAGGREVAARLSWDVIVDRQERIYRQIVAGAA
jgi:glycosyltransferase involved in cell wall biosynthesis